MLLLTRPSNSLRQRSLGFTSLYTVQSTKLTYSQYCSTDPSKLFIFLCIYKLCLLVQYNMQDYFALYQILKIPPLDIFIYFLANFVSAGILVLSFMAFICCNVLFTLYHMYMMKDEENSSRLLNIFYGHYALTLQLSSFFLMIAVFFESISEPIVAAEENGDNFACIVNRIRLLLVCMMLVEQIEITIATILRHFKPTIYLRISLKWFPKLGFVFLIFVSFIILAVIIYMFDNDIMCSSMSANRKITNIFSIILIVSGMIQVGILVDCSWGWKTIKKRLIGKKIRFRNRVSPYGQRNLEHISLSVINQQENSGKVWLKKV